MNTSNPSLEQVLFEAALEKSSDAERAAFLDGVCRDNPALRVRLVVLLEGHFRAEGFLPSGSVRPDPKPGPGPRETEATSTFIGRYKLLERIGEGGFGEVWMADQREPVKRRVALKIIKLGMDTRQVVARFEAERQALAMMEHPNIAKVLDGGATETGRPYFVMELVRGVRITDYCETNQLEVAQRLQLFIQVCRAIQHAHQKGVVHRDIKPSNILVTLHDGAPVPKVIDFGIAKATQQELTEKTVFTQFRQFLGTPAYVSPEQASMSGLDVDTRSDIYSLGVLLYELLTGTTPFNTQELIRAGLEGMCQIIRERQPPRPSTRLTRELTANQTDVSGQSKIENQKSKIAADLDWIVMKCLEKDRARRYETANGVARDIERHLRNEPVLARPPSRLYEFQKTVQRHWVGFGAIAAILAALGIGLTLSTVETVRARRAERLGERRLYASEMNLAQAAWEQNRIAQVRQLLNKTASYPERGFEWYYWQRQTHLELLALRGHLDWVQSVAYSPDGRQIATGSSDTTARVWDAGSGREMLALVGHRNDVLCVAFSPDGRRIATASRDATAKIWDAASGKPLLSFEGHSGQIQCVAFSPDGQQVVTASWDGTAKVWNAATGKASLTVNAHSGPVLCAAFSPDGLRFATGSDDRLVRICDAVTGNELLSLKGHSGRVWWVAFSRDGARMLTGSDDRTAKVWESATGRPVLTLRGHGDMVNTALFSPDGQRILTASDDHTVKIWDAATGQELFTIKGHDDKVNAAAFSPDGQRLVTGSDDRTAKVWDAMNVEQPLTLLGHTDVILGVAFSPDSQRILTGSQDGTAKVWNTGSGKALFTVSGHTRPVRSVAFSPEGQRIATGGGDGTAKVWDATTGHFLLQLDGHSGPVTHVEFSPGGQRIATSSSDRSARVWEASHGKPLLTLIGHSGEVSGLAFSPDGRRIATASADRTVRVWDAVNGQSLAILAGHSDSVRSVAFAPNGRWLLSGGNDRSVRQWDAATGLEQFSLTSHSDQVMGVAFSPDGRRLLTGSKDHTAKVWAASGEELLTLEGHDNMVYCVAFSGDGQRIVTGSADTTAKVWEAATADQVTAWQREEEAAARRLAAKATAEREVRDQSANDPGAVKQWLLLGPINFQGHSGANALAQEQVADEAHLSGRAEQPIRVGANELRWRAVQLQHYLISFRQLYANPPWSVAYALCYLHSDTGRPGLSMKVSSEDLSKVYLNGIEVYRCEKSQKYFPDQDVTTVNLKAGANVLLFKLVNEQDEWRGSIRFTDAAGQPLKGIRVSLTPL